MKLKKSVKMIEPETKEHIVTSWNITGDYTGSNTALNGTYTYVNLIYNGALSRIAQSTDYNGRVGREVKPFYLELEAVMNGSNTIGLNHPYRLIIYQDRGYDGANLPSLNMLLSGISTATGEYNNFFASYNPDYVSHKGDRKNRFKILIDKKGFIAPRLSQTVTAGVSSNQYQSLSNSSVYLHVKKRLKNAEIINYSGTSNGTHVGGSIFYVLLLGNSSTAGDNASAHLRTRLLYTDT